ncbi:hypothetical protein AQUCO_05900020v1 [Aquilegia coerulea]|uniref:Uncharacterized protein n=1 Tax=Aquilegia coerulea TaxID=218851 RepID=A0A2G5CE01_AQUCA|nr:hypothetical protein AQUCO_05900020v1 [Aquilegia coerulea]
MILPYLFPDAHPQRDEDVVAKENKPSDGLEDDVVQNDNKDDDVAGDNAKEMSLIEATHEAGNTNNFETSPISLCTGQRKRKRSTRSRRKRQRQIRSDVSNSGASETIDVNNHQNENAGTATVSGIEPQTVEVRKTEKMRMMTDIYNITEPVTDDLYESEPDTDLYESEPAIDLTKSDPDIDLNKSDPDIDLKKRDPADIDLNKSDPADIDLNKSDPADIDLNKSDPDVDLNEIRPYIDLNLSPTHQGMGIQYEDDEDLQCILQKNVPKEVEEAAAGNQHAVDKEVEEAAAGNQPAADANDQMLTSRKRKGKMLLYEENKPSLKTSQWDTSRGVQINNENVRGQGFEAHNNGQQRIGPKTIQSKDKAVNSQVIDDRPQLMRSKQRSITLAVNGSSSLGYQPEVHVFY